MTLVTPYPVSEESTVATHPFLDLAPLSAAHVAPIEARVARRAVEGGRGRRMRVAC